MKTFFSTALLAGTLAFSPASHARDFIFGLNLGFSSVDLDDRTEQRDPLIAKVTVGYEILDLAVADIAVEFDYARSLTRGEADNDKYDYTSKGLFLSARTIGPLYAVGRAGLLQNNFDFDCCEDIETDGTAISAGVGFSSGVRTEVMLTRYNLDGEGKADTFSVNVSF